MKRLFLIFLLILVPLQFAQAAVCGYCCEDESPVSTSHTDTQKPVSLMNGVDAQTAPHDGQIPHHSCASCHMACAKLLLSSQSAVAPLLSASSIHFPPFFIYSSPVSYIPDRPNWLAAA